MRWMHCKEALAWRSIRESRSETLAWPLADAARGHNLAVEAHGARESSHSAGKHPARCRCKRLRRALSNGGAGTCQGVHHEATTVRQQARTAMGLRQPHLAIATARGCGKAQGMLVYDLRSASHSILPLPASKGAGSERCWEAVSGATRSHSAPIQCVQCIVMSVDAEDPAALLLVICVSSAAVKNQDRRRAVRSRCCLVLRWINAPGPRRSHSWCRGGGGTRRAPQLARMLQRRHTGEGPAAPPPFLPSASAGPTTCRRRTARCRRGCGRNASTALPCRRLLQAVPPSPASRWAGLPGFPLPPSYPALTPKCTQLRPHALQDQHGDMLLLDVAEGYDQLWRKVCVRQAWHASKAARNGARMCCRVPKRLKVVQKKQLHAP